MQDGNEEKIKIGKYMIMRPMWDEEYDDRVFVLATDDLNVYGQLQDDEAMISRTMRSVRLMHSAQSEYVRTAWLAGGAIYQSTCDLLEQVGVQNVTAFTVSKERVMMEARASESATKH